jgi:D-alanyl-D-alanine carboxypeptidase (penicillin-binding protein 5/6)
METVRARDGSAIDHRFPGVKNSMLRLRIRGLGSVLLLAVLAIAVPASGQAQDRPATTATLGEGDTGRAVEDLQRNLNAKLDPSPDLSIDGDFGSGTRAAVERFQRARGLKPTGVADTATLAALGPPPKEAEVPPPGVVNARPVERRPPDPLDGPPYVTAKAWVVVDGRTGAVVAGHREAEPLEMASTTKMMTALVVLRIAKDDPEAFDEVVTFSGRADRTPGSTSAVRTGERVRVRELLYGLLLPSGNDASVALAEHFGGRLDPPADSPNVADPLPRFVAEMNRVAGELGLDETHFANTHGLPARDHHASARDLARLASVALADPTFARVVATPRRGAHLDGPREGEGRNVIWNNTNHLLGIEGYDGVKTGTTGAAGACLVASGRRGEDHRIVVILGATSSDARYTDARNLFRWAWSRRAHGD